ncbi:MAG TPA: TetR/AcrR family transcriptional regulator [Devosiaceae bacterium]
MMIGKKPTAVQMKGALEAADAQKGRRVAGEDPAKRKQILDGALRVFMRQGFDAASMNDITREAGVSKGTIYVYFANKEELFGALIDRERTATFESLSEVLRTAPTMREALMGYGELMASKLTSQEVLKAQRVVLGVMERMPDLAARFYQSGPQQTKIILHDYLRQKVDQGALRIDDIELAAQQFGDLCMSGVFRPCLFGVRHSSPSKDELHRIVTGAVDMFLAAYGTGQDKDAPARA